jgi:hypothetical protein
MFICGTPAPTLRIWVYDPGLGGPGLGSSVGPRTRSAGLGCAPDAARLAARSGTPAAQRLARTHGRAGTGGPAESGLGYVHRFGRPGLRTTNRY